MCCRLGGRARLAGAPGRGAQRGPGRRRRPRGPRRRALRRAREHLAAVPAAQRE